MIDQPDRWCLAAGACVAAGVVTPVALLPLVVGLIVAAHNKIGLRGAVTLGALVTLGAVTAVLHPPDTLDGFEDIAGSVMYVELGLIGDPVEGYGLLGPARVARADDPDAVGRVVLAGPLPVDALAGDTVVARGSFRPGVRRLGASTLGATFDVDEVADHRVATSPLFVVGNTIRRRVGAVFDGESPSSGLLRGFLIGDTTDVPTKHVEDLRRSGLAHFVAVSGSNVALFLVVWWFVALPLSIHPRLRSLVGLAGLAVFVVVTRWEPSVVRASVMASMVLGGGLVGIPVDPWMALGASVAAILLVAPDLVGSVGFLLSVFATIGVLVGVRLAGRFRPKWIALPVGATLGAQLAVAPILLVVFGTIPLLAPIANLIAAPVVATATALGMGAVVTPIPLLGSLAEVGASVVLGIAERAAMGPQLGVGGVALVAALAGAFVFRPVRPLAIAAIVLTLVSAAAKAPRWPTAPTAVVLDVGQGDAILLQDPSGIAVLIDGGGSPRVIDRALRRNGVTRLDLVVMTHGDADHAGGLIDVVRSRFVGAVWVPAFGDLGPLGDALVEIAEIRGVPVTRVHGGVVVNMGSLTLRVLSPNRRFQSDNDGCVVMTVTAASSLLLPCDAERTAQAELPAVKVDAMVVPHHGSSTTDLGWLERTLPPIAVLSYGRNSFGHPHPDVLALLESAGVGVHHTFLVGDVTVPLG